MSSAAIDRRRTADVPRSTLRDLDTLAAGEILPTVAAAERLRRAAATDEKVERSLLHLLDNGDRLARMLSLHSLSTAPGNATERVLVAALEEHDLCEHAAWALSRRVPVAEALPTLTRVVAHGGFAAMPAQLTLEHWGAHAGERVVPEIRRELARCSTEGGWSRLVETLALVNEAEAARSLDRIAACPATAAPSLRTVHSLHADESRGGLRVAQILLRGRVDTELETAGSGDGGGVITLLVQLARELGRRPDIEQSIIIARAREGLMASDKPLGPGAAIVRLPFGPGENVPVSAMWEYRAQVEQALTATLAACGPIDAAHLRYADAGTFAAARALRQAGVRIVFTLAPDPHALIAEGERRGRLTRDSFAEAELDEHNLFRLRLVHELTGNAEQVVTLPRAGGQAGLERLVGRRLVSDQTSTIPEGIALEPLDKALRVVSGNDAALPSIAADLRAAIAALGEDRLGLPLILSVGRFHPIKGFPNLVEAWADDAALVDRFNLVLVGGDLQRPSASERDVIDEINAVVARQPAARAGLVLLGTRPHEDVANLLAIGRHGLQGTVAPAGIYACASAKEEFGVALLEALGSGLPVVAPAGSGPDSYLEDGVTGILVRPGCVHTLREGLHQAALLARDEQRAAQAVNLVRERFGIRQVASALAGTYRRAAEAC